MSGKPTPNLVEFIFRMFSHCFGTRVIGLENIPQSGPLILACNHLSNFDPVIMGGFAGKRRHSIYIIKKEISSWPILGWLFRHYGFIFIDRKRKGGDLHALKEALKVLKNGESLALFPEGTRSKTGKMGKAKAGIGFLVYHSGAQILPIRVVDTEKLPFKWGPKVIFGKPFNIKADETRPVKEQYQEFADKVMNEIKKLK